MRRRASVGEEIFMKRGEQGDRCAQILGTHLAQIVMVVLDGVRFVFLYEPAEQAPVRSFLHSAEHGTLDSIVVVKRGTRGHAGRVRKAARCAHWCLRCILVAARGQRRCVGVDSFLGFLEGVVSHGGKGRCTGPGE